MVDSDEYTFKGGGLWTWGNGEWGRLGHNNLVSHWAPALLRIDKFGLKKVKHVSAGAFHSAACTEDGCVYTWGLGSQGSLGHGDTESQWAPALVNLEFFGRTRVRLVACGGFFSLALTEHGALFSWGQGMFGVLGQV